MMKSSIVLNDRGEIAIFYTEPLETVPEWASIDIAQCEVFLGGEGMDSKFIKLEKEFDERIYAAIKNVDQVLLVQVKDDAQKEPQTAILVPLMIPYQDEEQV